MFGVLILLRPLTLSKTEVLSIDPTQDQTINILRNGIISIVDSSDCFDYTNGVCLSRKCDVSLSNSDFLDLCVFYLKLNSEVTFQKLIINCPTGECTVDIDSTNFKATSLFVYGDKVTMKSSTLVVDNFFFDTVDGNLRIEMFQGSLASVSTTNGDIAIQVQKEAKLSTFSSSRNVCVTSEKGWKDAATSIATLDDVLVEKNGTTQTCFEVYSSVDRDYSKMIENNSHPVFNQLTTSTYAKSSETRCVSITDLMLLKSVSDLPASISSYITIQAATAEGNIYVNVIKDPSDTKRIISPPITNPVFDLSNLKLSNTWIDNLNQTFSDIYSSGKFHELVFLNFGQEYETSDDFQWIVSFTPAYLHFSPKWVSTFTFYTLSSKQEQFEVRMSPGFCPFFFRYQQSNEIEQQNLLSSRQRAIDDVLSSFFTLINVDPYIVILSNTYKQIKVSDRSTYPDLPKVTESLPIVALAELIFIGILIIAVVTIPNLILQKIINIVRAKELQEKAKIMFYLLKFIEPQNQNDKGFPKILKFPTQEIVDDFNTRIKQPQSLASSENKIYPQDKLLQEIPDEMDNLIEMTKLVYDNQEQDIEANLNKADTKELIQPKPSKKVEKFEITSQSEGEFGNILVHLSGQNQFGTSFQDLATSGAAWLQSRFVDSLEFFYKIIFNENEYLCRLRYEEGFEAEKVEKVLNENELVIQLSDLKMIYELFCYYYNFSQEEILSEQSSELLKKYGFQIEFEKRIVLDESKYKDWKQCNESFHPAIIEQFKNIHDMFPDCYDISLPFFLERAENNIYKSKLQSTDEQLLPKNIESFINSSKFLISQQLNGLVIKVSPNLVVSRQQKSIYKIDASILKQLTKIYGKNVFLSTINFHGYLGDRINTKRQNTNKPIFYQPMPYYGDIEPEINREKKRTMSLVRKINWRFANNFANLKSFNIYMIVEILQQISLQVTYVLSPIVFCLPEIFALIIYSVETNKNYENQQSTIWETLFTFSNVFASLITYLSILFIIIFFVQFLKKNILLLQLIVEVPCTVTLLYKNMINKNIERKLRIFENLNTVATLQIHYVFFGLIILSISYFLATFSFLFMGSILVPKVQLPIVIFIGVLVTVIGVQVSQFSQTYEQGKGKLYERFRKNLLKKFEEYLKEEENNQEGKKVDNADLKNAISEIKNEEKEDEIINAKQIQIRKELKIQDSHYYDLDDLEEMFQKIDLNLDDSVQAIEIFNQFDRMGMRISLQHLSQIFAHAKIAAQPKLKYIHLGNPELKELNKKEFSFAIEQFCNMKVNQALYFLDISYEVLFLSIVKIIFQSIVIGILIYSIFKGLSTADSSFDFNTNSIASLGGIIGILFTSRDESAKLLENVDVINQTIQRVENLFHTNNPEFPEYSAEQINSFTPSSPSAPTNQEGNQEPNSPHDQI